MRTYSYKKILKTYKFIVSVFLLTTLLSPSVPTASASTPQWQTMGPEGFTTSNGLTPFIKSEDGTIYIAYANPSDGLKANVVKWNGSSWENVGLPDFSAGGATYISLAFSDGTPYIAFRDGSQSNKLTVMKYDEIAGWSVVGSAGFSDFDARASLITTDRNGNLYIAYNDYYYDEFSGDPPNNIKVLKYNGSSWVQVGSTLTFSYNASLLHVSLVFSEDNTPYLAVPSADIGPYIGKNKVFKYSGSDWETFNFLSTDAIAQGAKNNFALAFNNGSLYTVFSETLGTNTTTKGAYVAKVNNSGSWDLQSTSTLNINGIIPSIAFLGNKPYVAYQVTSDKIYVKSANGQGLVGDGAISAGAGVTPMITSDGKTLYVVYIDSTQGGKLTVKKYTPSEIKIASPETNKTIALSTPSGTDITCSSTSKESDLQATDSNYSYPLGFVNFCFDTDSNNNQVSVTFETDLTPSQVVARKYNPDTKQYKTIDGASVTETTINGNHALKVTYTIVDNGELDTDPAIGSISDPIGLGLREASADSGSTQNSSSANAPNTGAKRVTKPLGLIVVGALLLATIAGRGCYRVLNSIT